LAVFAKKPSLMPDILLLLTCNRGRMLPFPGKRRLTMPSDFYSLESRIAASARRCKGNSQSLARLALDLMHGVQSI
jgi:hypothetical protein